MHFKHLVPLLDVNNIEESIAFYKDALGFTIVDTRVWNGKTEWVLLHGGNVALMLAENGRQITASNPTHQAGMFFFYLEDTQPLYSKLKALGYPLSNVQYSGSRVREFCLEDPDGYILWFSPKWIYKSHENDSYEQDARGQEIYAHRSLDIG